MRKLLMCAGAISVSAGVMMGVFFPATEPVESIFEPIPIEENKEVQVNIEQVTPPEPVVEVETGEITLKVIEYTQEEAIAMLQVMSAEAADQGEEGMWLVGSVIENRRQKEGKAYHPEGDHTVQGVVFKEGQFSSVTNGSYLTCEIPPEAHEALARLERGDVAPQIIAFERIDSEVLDQYFDRAFEYKDHRFYTEKIQPKE